MLLPMAFPNAISCFLLSAAVMLVISSGKDVPIDTMVRPTSVSLIPKPSAMSLAEFTTKSPPTTMAINPPRI